MNAESASPLPFNPAIFRWAREFGQFSVHEAAKKVGTSPENVQSWEDGDGIPTVRQARLLAKAYGRSFLEFFLDRPPNLPDNSLVPDYRLHKHVPKPDENRELKKVQSWAEESRMSALDLYEIIGEEPPAFPKELYGTLESNPEQIAALVREIAAFPIEEQIHQKSSERANFPKVLRRAIERLGVLVLKNSALNKFGARGLCIVEHPLPVIVFGTEAPAAQCFTMAHELGHIALSQSAISGPPTSRDNDSKERAVERWCDQFAGALLVPSDAMMEIWARPNSPVAALGDDALRQYANMFGISRHAMLIRLVDLGYVVPDYYWDIKRQEFLDEESKYKGGGRPKYYGTRYKNSLGDLYTGLVMEAWDNSLITNHNAAEFMGIKNLDHLNDIRDDFSPS